MMNMGGMQQEKILRVLKEKNPDRSERDHQNLSQKKNKKTFNLLKKRRGGAAERRERGNFLAKRGLRQARQKSRAPPKTLGDQ